MNVLVPTMLALAYIIAPPWAHQPRRGRAGMRPRAVGRPRRNHLPSPGRARLRGGRGAPTGFSQRLVGAVNTPPEWRERHMMTDLIVFGGVAVVTLAAIAAALLVTR